MGYPMNSIHLRKARLEAEPRRALEGAARELSRKTGDEYDLAKALFGRVIATRVKDIVVAGVGTNSRPGSTTIVAVDSEQRIFLPSISDRDFKDLCERLDLSEEAVDDFRELVHPPLADLR